MAKQPMMNDAELDDAGNALINWMKSQDISPANGTAIFIKIMATQLVAKTTNNEFKLYAAIQNINKLLTIEVAAELRRLKNV